MIIRYRYIERTVLDLYKSLPKYVLAFPLNPIEIINQFSNCKLWSYQYYAKLHNITIGDVINFCESDSGCVNYNRCTHQYLILFNNSTENNNVAGRRNFTLCHELGHIILRHFQSMSNNMIAENNLTHLFN